MLKKCNLTTVKPMNVAELSLFDLVSRRWNKVIHNRDGGFYMHLGSISHGCITIDKNNKSEVSKYQQLSKMLKKPTNSPIIMHVIK